MAPRRVKRRRDYEPPQSLDLLPPEQQGALSASDKRRYGMYALFGIAAAGLVVVVVGVYLAYELWWRHRGTHYWLGPAITDLPGYAPQVLYKYKKGKGTIETEYAEISLGDSGLFIKPRSTNVSTETACQERDYTCPACKATGTSAYLNGVDCREKIQATGGGGLSGDCPFAGDGVFREGVQWPSYCLATEVDFDDDEASAFPFHIPFFDMPHVQRTLGACTSGDCDALEVYVRTAAVRNLLLFDPGTGWRITGDFDGLGGKEVSWTPAPCCSGVHTSFGGTTSVTGVCAGADKAASGLGDPIQSGASTYLFSTEAEGSALTTWAGTCLVESGTPFTSGGCLTAGSDGGFVPTLPPFAPRSAA